jgi:hypothetical protein
MKILKYIMGSEKKIYLKKKNSIINANLYLSIKKS